MPRLVRCALLPMLLVLATMLLTSCQILVAPVLYPIYLAHEKEAPTVTYPIHDSPVTKETIEEIAEQYAVLACKKRNWDRKDFFPEMQVGYNKVKSNWCAYLLPDRKHTSYLNAEFQIWKNDIVASGKWHFYE